MLEFYLDGAALTIAVAGRMTSDTSPSIEKGIVSYLSEHPIERLALEFKELEYISSAGIRIVLSLLNQYGEITILHPSDAVYEVFYIAGMEDFFKFVREAPSPAPNKDVDNRKTAKAHYSSYQDTPTIPLTGINDTSAEEVFLPAHTRFEELAKKTPDKIAVITKERKITYAALNAAANKVAQSLLYLGIDVDDVICIMLPRGIDTYIATLGVMKAGAAYTIVNIGYPDERIKYIFQDASCKYMISTREGYEW